MKNMNFLKVCVLTGLILFGMAQFSVAQENKEPRFLWTYSDSDSLLFVKHLSPATVIKFKGDSIVFSDSEGQEKLHQDCFSYLRHTSDCISDFTVKVNGNVSKTIPLEGTVVLLLGEELEDYAGLIQFTDSIGEAAFPHLPYGTYQMSIIDSSRDFISQYDVPVMHRYFDSHVTLLPENLISPHSGYCEIAEESDNNFRIELFWKMEDIESLNDPFRGYEFFIEYDGEFLASTPFMYYTIRETKAGKHLAEIYARSRYGTVTERLPIEILVETNSVDLIDDEPTQWIYYDLNGVLIDGNNLKPGIYIRTDGRKREKILIK